MSFEKRLCPNPELHWCCGSTVGPAAIWVVSLGDSGLQSRATLGHSLHFGCTCKLRSRLPVLDSGPCGGFLPVQPQAIHFTSPGFRRSPQLYQRCHNMTSLQWLVVVHEQRVCYSSKKPPGENLISPAICQQKLFLLKERRNAYDSLKRVISHPRNIILLHNSGTSKSMLEPTVLEQCFSIGYV